MNEPLSDARLAEIEARANAATPGPWSPAPYSGADPHDRIVVGSNNDWLLNVGALVHEAISPKNPQEYADAEFIAHARTDVPALVAEVRRLREREAALEKVVALAECGPPMHRFPVAPPIIGFTDNEGPIYPPGYDPTKHADDCTGCKFNAARAALAALDAKEKPHD